MTAQSIIGYVLTSLVAPLAGWLCGHYGQTELGGVLAVGLAAVGGRLLHTSDPPAGKGPSAGVVSLLLLAPFLGVALGAGCAWLQRPATQRVVKCSGDIVNACKADVLPTVTACLNAPANPTGCLMALLNAGGCATTEALACRVKQAAEPSVIMTFVSPTAEEQAAADRRRANAARFYSDVGVRPE